MLRRLALALAAAGALGSLVGAARPAPAKVPGHDGLIVFASDRADNLNAFEIFSVSVDGRARRNLSRTPDTGEFGARLSPDGRWLLYQQSGPDASTIYVARPDGADAHAVASGSSPAWAPDGERIAFDVGYPRMIHVVARTGGTAVPLTRGALAGWSPDGTRIAFVDATPGLRFFVIGADGTGRRSLAPDLEYWGEVLSYPPQWSPDGRRLLLTTKGPAAAATIAIVELATGEAATLGPGRHPKWSPDGRLVVFDEFVNGRFGIGVAEVATGAVTHLASSRALAESPVWSPSGRQIAFFRGGQVWLVQVDGTGLRRLTREPPTSVFVQYDEPVFLDESTVAFSSWLQEDNDFDLYTMRSDGTDMRQLTDTLVDEGEPAWSPDGRRIMFVRNPPNCDTSHGVVGCGLVYVMNSDGTDVHRITTVDTQPASSPTWSPDGRSIAFVGRAAVDFAIYRATSAGRRLRRVPGAALSAEMVDWSPRGDLLAYVRTGDVFTVSLRHGRENQVTRGAFGNESPAWAPDGRRLALARVYACGEECYRYELVLKALGAPARRLAGDADQPAWSPDGRLIAYHEERSGSIGVIRRDGTNRTLITTGAGDDRDPDWRPR